MRLAVIETGGKQYIVSAGKKLKIEKIEGAEGGAVTFDKVLLESVDNAVKVGTPYLPGVTVEAKIVRQARDRKKIVFKYHSKTRYRKKKGHKQFFTEVEIVKV